MGCDDTTKTVHHVDRHDPKRCRRNGSVDAPLPAKSEVSAVSTYDEGDASVEQR
jgi:hypothetical protein